MQRIPDICDVKEYSVAEQMLARTLAKTLRARREELGFSQEKVAQDAGIDRTTYQLMESGLSDRSTNNLLNPRLFTLFNVASVLKLSATALLAQAEREYFAAQLEHSA